jgi:PhnB protein
MQIQPYLYFHGRCEEAVEFYRRALGAEVVMLMRFRDAPDPPPDGATPGSGDKIMHGELRIGDTTMLVSDGDPAAPVLFRGFGLALGVPDAAVAERLFGALADGGEIGMPLGRTFFSPCFGVVTDRFGIEWMVNAAA